MKPVILACGNLVHYVMAAQKKCGTHYPVVALNMRLHVDPPKMREAAVDALDRRIPGKPMTTSPSMQKFSSILTACSMPSSVMKRSLLAVFKKVPPSACSATRV